MMQVRKIIKKEMMRKSPTRKPMVVTSIINDGEKVNGDEKIKRSIKNEKISGEKIHDFNE